MNLPATTAGHAVCLCVIFNHPFTANIPLLRALYAGRFSQVRFLVPLARSDEPDVMTVYRGSFAHHAYVGDCADALRRIDCTHYLAIHDDVVLAPWVDENNILGLLGVAGPREGFIGSIAALWEDVGDWAYQVGSLWRLLHPRNSFSGTGVEDLHTVLAHLPPQAEAAAKAAAHGIPATTTFRRTRDSLTPGRTLARFPVVGHRDPQAETRLVGHLLDLLFGAGTPAEIAIPYPIALGGPDSDLCVIPAPALDDYAHAAGVLAAAGLFVEMAGPTALLLACDRVRTMDDARIGAPQWWLETVSPDAVLDRYETGEHALAIHPVKLSRIADPAGFLRRMAALRTLPPGLPDRSRAATVHAEFPDFDRAGYLARAPDVALAGGSPYEHFLRFGRAEGRRWKG